MRSNITPAVLTISDFLQWARIGRTRTYEEISSGALPTFKMGRRRYIRAADAEAWLERQIGVPLKDREAA